MECKNRYREDRLTIMKKVFRQLGRSQNLMILVTKKKRTIYDTMLWYQENHIRILARRFEKNLQYYVNYKVVITDRELTLPKCR